MSKIRLYCSYRGCTKFFYNYDVLEEHLKEHKVDLPFKCNIPGCGKLFKSKQSFKLHMDRHMSDEKPV